MRDLTFKSSATSRFAFQNAIEENTGSIAEVVDKNSTKVEEFGSFVGETFTALYRPKDTERALDPDDVVPWARKAHGVLESQGAWPELRAASQAHPVIAAQAAAKLATVVADAMGLDKATSKTDFANDPHNLARRIRALNAMKERLVEENDSAGAKDMDQAMADAWESMRNATTRRKRGVDALDTAAGGAAIGASVRDIANAAQEQAAMVGLLRGWGLGGGVNGDEGEVDAELIALLVKDKNLKRILEQVGRIQARASARGVATVAEGHLDVVGVANGGDLSRFVPAELMKFAHPVLADDVTRRMLERGVLSWEMAGEENADRGDMLIDCDRSGSMAGEPMVWMRAVAACAMLQAVEQKRRIVLTLFDDTATSVIVEPATAKRDLVDALKLLAEETRGGTNIDGVLRYTATMRAAKNLGRADTLIITDGIFPRPPKDVVDALRSDNARVHLVCVGFFGGDDHKTWVDTLHNVTGRDDESGVDVLAGLAKA